MYLRRYDMETLFDCLERHQNKVTFKQKGDAEVDVDIGNDVGNDADAGVPS